VYLPSSISIQYCTQSLAQQKTKSTIFVTGKTASQIRKSANNLPNALWQLSTRSTDCIGKLRLCSNLPTKSILLFSSLNGLAPSSRVEHFLHFTEKSIVKCTRQNVLADMSCFDLSFYVETFHDATFEKKFLKKS
jgi:hypothetical protein